MVPWLFCQIFYVATTKHNGGHEITVMHSVLICW